MRFGFIYDFRVSIKQYIYILIFIGIPTMLQFLIDLLFPKNFHCTFQFNYNVFVVGIIRLSHTLGSVSLPQLKLFI